MSTTVHHVPKCMSFHEAIVVITRRVHCFHDCIYPIALLWDLSTLCYDYLYIYIYTTPSDINWYEVRRDFDKFANQLRYRVTHSTNITSSQWILSEPSTAGNINVIPNLPRKKSTTSRLFCSKETKWKSLELFIEAMESDSFNPSNIRKPRNNLKVGLSRVRTFLSN